MSSVPLSQLDATLKRELLRRQPAVLVLDRLRTLSNLGEEFPFQRLCGHGFSGPLTDLHARLLLALLCVDFLKPTYGGSGKSESGWSSPSKACSEVSAPDSLPHWARNFH